MKTIKYDIHDYRSQCPLAVTVENALNNCAPYVSNLERLESIFGYEDRLHCFLCACLHCWAAATQYDDRNRTVVLISREIIKHFPDIPKIEGVEICEELKKEAFGFTSHAHRYIQTILFRVLLKYFQKTGHYGLFDWYEDQEFLIDTEKDMAIPYRNLFR